MMNRCCSLSITRISLLVFYILLHPQIGLACQCQKTTTTFLKTVNKKSITLLIEVDNSYQIIDDFGYPLKLVRAKIINNFSSKYLGQHIDIMHGDLGDCIRDLPSIKKGKRYFINGSLKDVNDYLWFEQKHPLNSIFELFDCAENAIAINGNKVYGNITKNFFNRKYKKYRFLNFFSKKVAEKYYSKKITNSTESQIMNLSTVIALIRQKYDS